MKNGAPPIQGMEVTWAEPPQSERFDLEHFRQYLIGQYGTGPFRIYAVRNLERHTRVPLIKSDGQPVVVSEGEVYVTLLENGELLRMKPNETTRCEMQQRGQLTCPKNCPPREGTQLGCCSECTRPRVLELSWEWLRPYKRAAAL